MHEHLPKITRVPDMATLKKNKKNSCHWVNFGMSFIAGCGDFWISADKTLEKYFCDFQMFCYL